jgi:hypothetical protein
MEILARIPALAAAERAAISVPETPVADVVPRRTISSPRRSNPVSAVSIVMLALIAGAAWAAALWHDRVRALRQQPPARWAEAFEKDQDAATAGGVVR